jgi:hypothetical protein
MELEQESEENTLEKTYKAQEEIIAFAQRNQIKYDAHMKEKRGRKTITEFAEGSFVFIQYPSIKYTTLAPTKFHSRWRGPLKVIKADKLNRYIVQDLVTNKKEVVHISNMKLFLFEEDVHDPKDIALGDNREWKIEKIIEHVGAFSSQAKKSELQFKVRWLGLAEKFDKWLPWKELRLCEQLHNYLVSIKQEKHIPKNLTTESDVD